MILAKSSANLLGHFFLLVCLFHAVYSHDDREDTDEVDGEEEEADSSRRKFNTVCYFTNWGAHRAIKESRLYPENIPPALCTHILYAFGSISGTSVGYTLENDVRAVEGQGPLFERVMRLKERNGELKVLISFGGWGKAAQFEALVASKGAR